MQANVLFFQLHPDTDKDEALREFRDEVLPEVEQLPGHKNGLLLANWAIGKVILIILWETEAETHGSEHSGHYQRQAHKFAHLFRAPLVRELFEVVAHNLH